MKRPPAKRPAASPRRATDELERARAPREWVDPEHEHRKRQALIDRQRGERSTMAARHARELAELVERQAHEETALEAAQSIEFGRLREQLRPGSVGPWLEHQEARSRR